MNYATKNVKIHGYVCMHAIKQLCIIMEMYIITYILTTQVLLFSYPILGYMNPVLETLLDDH